MEPKTLKALKASIKKWERNVKVRKPENAKTGPFDCSLCLKFFEKGCHGCPVSIKTGEICCYDTPYWNARRALNEWLTYPEYFKHKWQTAAQAEVDFLKSLLPEGETNA